MTQETDTERAAFEAQSDNLALQQIRSTLVWASDYVGGWGALSDVHPLKVSIAAVDRLLARPEAPPEAPTEQWLAEAERLADVYAQDACRASDHCYGSSTIPSRAALLSHLRLRPEAGAQAVAPEVLHGLRNLKVLLGTDAPEVRGWAPAVQQAAQKTINAAIRALADRPTVQAQLTPNRCGYCGQDMLPGSECTTSDRADKCAMYAEFAATRKVQAQLTTKGPDHG